MATVYFENGSFIAEITSDGSVIQEIEQGVVVSIPNYSSPGPNPWDPPQTNTIRVVPIDGMEITGITSSPYLEFEKGYQSENWICRQWDANTHYEITVNVSGEGGNIPLIVSPYNKVYLVDSEIIEQFSIISAFVPNFDGSISEQLNNTDYIIALLNIPFKLPDDIVGDIAYIQLGKLDTEIEAPNVDADIIHVPLGEIVVDDLLNNSIDYVATEYVLVLPYITETIPLNPEWVIDKVISVDYLIDAYTGDMTVNVYNGGDAPITSIVSSIGRTIPFKTLISNITEMGRNSGAYNGTLAAYIRKSRNETYSGEFSNFVSSEGDLGDYLGYVEVDNINLKTSATLSENQSIVSILASGVIIQ